MVDDEDLWVAGEPCAAGIASASSTFVSEREAMDSRGWLVERLGVGAWPDPSGVAAAPITGEEWAELLDRGSKRAGEIVLAFDITADRHCALVVCGRRGTDDLLHLEVLRTAPGSAWLPDELERLHDRYDVRAIVCDDYGGNRAVARELEDAGLPVRTVSGGEHAGACGKLLDLVAERGFRHIGQPEFLAALRGAKSKPSATPGCWTRKQSTGDAALVVAMTLALSAGSEIPADAGDPVIY